MMKMRTTGTMMKTIGTMMNDEVQTLELKPVQSEEEDPWEDEYEDEEDEDEDDEEIYDGIVTWD